MGVPDVLVNSTVMLGRPPVPDPVTVPLTEPFAAIAGEALTRTVLSSKVRARTALKTDFIGIHPPAPLTYKRR
jgi:hypothetical protein